LVRRWLDARAAEHWLPELASVASSRLAAADRVEPARRDPVLLTALLLGDATAALRRLRASNAEIERVAAMAKAPAEPAGDDPRSVRRWLAAVGRSADDVLLGHAILAGQPPPWAAEVERIRQRGDPLARGDLAVTGSDLQALGAAGPRVGQVLAVLLDRVLDDPALNRRDALLALAREQL
jgi:tRNA nucleotidyltransferase (CCA-adding enzyme)